MINNNKSIDQSLKYMKDTVINTKIKNNMSSIINNKQKQTNVVYQNRSQVRKPVLRRAFQMKLF